MTDSTDRLIAGIVDELEPVRPLPRLRTAFSVILALWAALLGVVLWGQEGGSMTGSAMADRVYLAAFLGLAVASVGGTISALAAGTPGRERLELTGMALALVGLLAAVVACLIGIWTLGPAAPVSPAGVDAMCLQRSAMLSLLPAGVILSFLVRGWAAHPVRASLVALAASGALGSIIAHLSCDFVAPAHLLAGHLSVPFALALLGFYPLAVILRRLRG